MPPDATATVAWPWPARLAAVLAASLLLAFLGAGVAGAAWLGATGAALLPVALGALGARRRGRLGRAAWVLLLWAASQGAGLAAMLAWRGGGGPWLGGLPGAAAAAVYGLWLLPLLPLGLGFAWAFGDWFPVAGEAGRPREGEERGTW